MPLDPLTSWLFLLIVLASICWLVWAAIERRRYSQERPRTAWLNAWLLISTSRPHESEPIASESDDHARKHITITPPPKIAQDESEDS